MKYLRILFLVLLPGSCKNQMVENGSDQLQKIISAYEAYEGYDEDEYPLGLFTKAYFKAEQQLGDRFNIRDFHEVVLGQGTVTLSILEKRIKDYITTNGN